MSIINKEHKTKNSVGYKLLRVVFSFYILIAIIVTAAHMFSEYKNAKNIIFEDMLNIEYSFKNQLVNSVWHFDNELIEEVISGILSTRSIIGITIQSKDSDLIKNAGIIDIKYGNPKNNVSKVQFKSNLYIHSFDLISKSYNNGEKLGVVHIYSDDSVIYNIVKNNFALIIINSLIKTLALWLIFLYFSHKYLTKPFYEIIQTLSDIDFNKIKEVKLSNKFHDQSEFEMLETSFNIMLIKLENTYRQIQDANEQNKELNITLENKVRERTYELEDSNTELEQTIQALKQTQEQLIQSEKMASLGGLVAGVAHEINTPVGTSLTGMTHIYDRVVEIQKLYDKNDISEEEFSGFLKLTKEISDSVIINLKQTSKLINSFKSIAASNSNDEIIKLDLNTYINGIILNYEDKIKQNNIKILFNCDENIIVTTYPGAIFQIFSNLIMNSINHGFEQKSGGEITIDIIENVNSINFIYKDNGIGIKEEILPKIFEPFFTTNRQFGGTGLGLNIVYNIITSQLKGDISCESTIGEGVVFKMTFYNLK